MRRAASHNEKCESHQEERPVRRNRPARPPSQIKQRDANTEIADEGDRVGDRHCPDKTRILFPANRMRHQRWIHKATLPLQHKPRFFRKSEESAWKSKS